MEVICITEDLENVTKGKEYEVLEVDYYKFNDTKFLKYWTVEKVEWLQVQILIELQNLGNFDLA